jgi:hypothetical protein
MNLLYASVTTAIRPVLRAAGAVPPPPAKLGLEKYKSGMHSAAFSFERYLRIEAIVSM